MEEAAAYRGASRLAFVSIIELRNDRSRLGTERQQMLAAIYDSLQSTYAGFESDPYRPWEQLAELTLTKGIFLDTGEMTRGLQLKAHTGRRIVEDVSAERVLCDVMHVGGRVIWLSLRAGSPITEVSTVGDASALAIALWTKEENEQESWRRWACSALAVHCQLQRRLGSAWHLSRWRAYSSGPHKEACRSIDFGYTCMPGGSKLQTLAHKRSVAYPLRSLHDPEGLAFCEGLIVPWLQAA
eukprot:6198723-Pleurochrysis_carterae.AAC.3